MAAKSKSSDSCLQCAGDNMLEVRKHASEVFSIMDRLTTAYGQPVQPAASVVEFVRALIEAEHDQQRLQCLMRYDAEKRIKAVAELVASLRFISDATKETYSSGASLSSKAMTIPLTELFRVAINRLESMIVADRGLLEGKQPQNQKDFLTGLVDREKGGA